MGLKNTIIRNLITGWVGKSVSIISAIIVTPILLAHFGKYEYGMWVTIGQGASLLMLLDFGIANSVSRFIARNIALEDNEENVRVFSTALAIFFSASVLVLILTAIILPLIPDIFHIDDHYRGIAFWLFGLTGVNIAVIFPLRVARGLLQARDRYDLIFLYQTVFSLLRLILVVLIFGRGTGNLLLLALIIFGLNLLVEMTLFGTAMKQHQNLRFKANFVTKKNFKELTSLGASSLFQTLSGTLDKKAQVIFVGIILGLSSSPLLLIPYTIINRLGPFISRLGGTFTPIASRMDARGEVHHLQKLNILGVRYGLGLSIPIGIFLVLYGNQLLTLWLGRTGLALTDITSMARVLCIMAIPFAIGWPQIASRAILRGTGKHWLVANSGVLSSLLGLITGILIMMYSSWGILGAAIGWAMSFSITHVFLYPLFICRHLKIPGWHYFKEAYMLSFGCASILVIFSIFLKGFLYSVNISTFVIFTLLFGIVSCFLFFYLVLLPEHRTYLFSILAQRMAVIKHSSFKNSRL